MGTLITTEKADLSAPQERCVSGSDVSRAAPALSQCLAEPPSSFQPRKAWNIEVLDCLKPYTQISPPFSLKTHEKYCCLDTLVLSQPVSERVPLPLGSYAHIVSGSPGWKVSAGAGGQVWPE